MYSRSNRIFSLTALAVGLGLAAIPASAQQVAFHLPFAVHWGHTVLEPGDYKLSAPIEWSGSRLIHVSQPGHGRMILPQSIEVQQPHFDRSSLELVNIKGTYFVKRYKSAPTGHVFTFPVPKAMSETEMASAAVTTVPVASAKRR